MKARGILYGPEMIRAKLEGRKTMTRRSSGLKAINENPTRFRPDPGNDVIDYFFRSPRETYLAKCPYGKVGDILYARETYLILDKDHIIDGSYVYKADSCADTEEIRMDYIKSGRPYQWKPSLFMPKAAARIIDQIVSIKVERLREITSADIVKEGACTQSFLDQNGIDKTFTQWFKLWTSIHKEYNPDLWLWVIETKNLSTTGWKGVDNSILSKIENYQP